MFTINFIKQIDNEYVTYTYSCRFFTHSENGKFVLYGFSGTEEDAVIWVNDDNYEQAYVMNREGKTIDSHRVALKT